MAWKALVPPRLGTQDDTGMCLRFAQSFFGAPVAHPSAWVAWQHVQGKYAPSDPLPDVPVILWFEHWGTYGDPARYDNWGHVAVYVPGDAIYTSPAGGYGQQRYSTIGQIERAFNCRYVGWSPDINGLLVADYVTGNTPARPAKPVQEDDMYSDADRARDNTVRAEMKITMEAVGRIETKLYALAKEVNQIHISADVSKWALTDKTAGVRSGLASIAKLVTKLPGSTLDPSQIEAALSPEAVTKIAKAVTDEHAKRLQE